VSLAHDKLQKEGNVPSFANITEPVDIIRKELIDTANKTRRLKYFISSSLYGVTDFSIPFYLTLIGHRDEKKPRHNRLI